MLEWLVISHSEVSHPWPNLFLFIYFYFYFYFFLASGILQTNLSEGKSTFKKFTKF